MAKVKVNVIRDTLDEGNAETIEAALRDEQIDADAYAAAFAETEIPTTPEGRVRRRRRLALALVRVRHLQTPSVDLPVIGHVHAPAKHDVIYVASIGVLIAAGVIEWPIALAVIGGHALVKQQQSRSLSAVGRAMEDAFAH